MQVAIGIVRLPSLKFNVDHLVRISLLITNGILPIPSIDGGYVEISVRLQKLFPFVLVDTPCWT